MDILLSYNEREHITNLLNKTNRSNLELEIRLGYFQEHFFKSTVDFEKYKTILNMNELFSEHKPTYIMMLVCKSQSNTQKIITYKNNLPIKTEYRKKNRVQIVNLNLLQCRIALSEEIDMEKSNENFDDCFRFKDRITRISKDGKWRFDFTKVYELNIKNENIKDIKQLLSKSKYHYEIEIEYLDKISNLNLKSIEDKLDMIKKNGFNNNRHILRDIQKLFSNEIDFNRSIKKIPPHMLNFKKITNHLVALNSTNINNIFENYSVTEKADGENNFIFISSDSIYLLNDRSNIKKLPLELTDKSLSNSLINGEYVDYLNSFYSFDILIYKGKEVTEEHLPVRYKYLKEFESGIKSNDQFKLFTKKYYMTDMFKSSNKIYNETKFPYKIDGLVFTPIKAGFRSTAYKWKPLNELTTDFLVKQSPEKDTFYLYVTINKGDLNKYNLKVDNDHDKLFPMFDKNAYYVPIKFQVPDSKKKTYLVTDKTLKDNTIVEFSYKNKWIPTRLRVDKTENYHKSIRMRKFFGPNAFIVALDTWNSLHIDPITADIITGKTPLPNSVKMSRYFTGKSRKESDIFWMNIFHSYIMKYRLYMDYIKYPRKNRSVLELAAGRGGDIDKWIRSKIRFLTVQDIDQVALDEIKNRLEKKKNQIKHRFDIKYVQGDLSTDMHTAFGNYKFDAISMQFAIHYMLKSPETLKNLFLNIDKNLKPGGNFIFTTLDGQLVFELLARNSIQYQESYDFMKNNKKILAIKRLYKDNTFEKYGQEISVYVETIGEHKGEYLVDFDNLLGFFVKNGYKLVKSDYFKNVLQTWENKSKMSEAEIQFSSLYRYMVLQKK